MYVRCDRRLGVIKTVGATAPTSTLSPDRSSPQSKHLHHLKHFGLGQRLGEDVSWHVRSAQMHNLNPSLGYFVPEPVEAQIEVLHAPMVLGIFRNRESREVVDVECGG